MAVAQSVSVARQQQPQRPGSWWYRNKRRVAPYIFISPFYILFLVFGIYPIFYSFVLSFYKGFGFDKKTFFGLGNYVHLFQDPRYYMAVANTTFYALGSLFILTPLALLVALAVNSALVKWKPIYRIGFFLPVITSSVVIAVIGARIFDQTYGLLNALLSVFHIAAVPWLSDKNVVMRSFVLLGIWNWLGVNMLYWIAGLNAISKDFYEAASIDGANKWQSFLHVTLPLLRPMTLFMVLQAIIGSYNLFAEPFLLTGGGPSDGSLTITLYLYNQGFQNFNVGYASAIAYSMALLLFILSIINIRVFGFGGVGD